MWLKGSFTLAILGAKPSVKLPVTPAVINGTVHFEKCEQFLE